MSILLLSIVLLLCAAAFVWFLHLERSGRPLTVIGFLLGLLIVESTLYYSPNEVAVGLLHPQIGSLSFRVFDLLVPLALIARLLSRRSRPLHVGVLWWLPFMAWMIVEAVLGVANHNSMQFLTFEAKLVIYLFLVPLAAGVPARDWLESRGLRRLFVFAAVDATVLMVTQLGHVSISASIPFLPLDGLGTFGSDLASVFVTMGIISITLALVVEPHRFQRTLVALPLLLCPLAVGQRAAMVALIVSIAALAVLVPFGRRRVRTTPTELALVGAVALCLLLLPTVAPAVSAAQPGQVPFARVVSEAFTSRSKQLSGQDRVNQWRKAKSIIAQRPIFGWGLGMSYVYWDPGYYQFLEINLTHNIVGDLLMRTGVVGLILFLIPVGIGIFVALRAWRRLIDPQLAALAVGAGAAVIGLLAKGLVESIFEKYRLAMVLAILFGLIVALDRALREPAPVTLRIMEDR